MEHIKSIQQKINEQKSQIPEMRFVPITQETMWSIPVGMENSTQNGCICEGDGGPGQQPCFREKDGSISHDLRENMEQQLVL